jgi:hypothetical protein
MKNTSQNTIIIFYDQDFFPEHNFWGESLDVEQICSPYLLMDFKTLLDFDLFTVKSIILPYGQRFPLEIYEKLKKLLANGGDIIVLGGAPFEKACVFDNNKWKINDPLQIGLWKEFFNSEWRNGLSLSFHNVVRESQWSYDGFSLDVNKKFHKAFLDSKKKCDCEAYLGKLVPLEVGRTVNIMSTTSEQSTAPSIIDFVTIVEPLHSRDIKGRILCAGFEADKIWNIDNHRSFLNSMLEALKLDNSSRSSLGMKLSQTTIPHGGELYLDLWSRQAKFQDTIELELIDAQANSLKTISIDSPDKVKLPVADLDSGVFTLLIKNKNNEEIKYPFSILPANSGKLPDFKVAKKNGYPIIEKDGYAIPAELYACDPVDRHLDGIIPDFSSRKIKIVNFLYPIMLSWKGEDEYDWTSLDYMIERILRRAPNALLFPRILLQTPPWWDKANPDELKVYRSGRNYVENKEVAKDGVRRINQLPIYSKFNQGGLSPRIKQASYYSKKWRKDIAKVMKSLAKHVEAQIWRNNFLGIFFGAGTCGEWGHFTENANFDWEDMSEVASTAFRGWLSKKYPNPNKRLEKWEYLKSFTKEDVKLPESPHLVATDFVHGFLSDPNKILNDAKNIAPGEIDKALPPNFARRHVSRYGFLKDPLQSADSIEYFSWLQESLPDLLNEISIGIRAAFSNKIIVGTFYGYLMQEYFVDLNDSADALGFPLALESSDSPDLYVAPHYYTSRELLSGDANVKTPTGSIRLSNKIFLDENDQRTIFSRRKNYMINGGTVNDSITENIEMCKRNFVARLSKNVGMWWYDLFGHGWFDHPEMMKTIEKTFTIYKEAIDTPNTASFADSDNRLNVIFATDAYKYHCACSKFSLLNTHEQIQKHFNRNGTQWEAFLKKDIKKAPQAKAWFFLNTFNMSKEECDWINNNLKCDNNILIWLYAPGIYRDGKINLNYASELTGINLAWDLDSQLEDIELENLSHPALSALKGKKVKGFLTGFKDAPKNSNIDRISPEIYVDDTKATALGRNSKNNRTSFAVRDFRDWKSVYIAAPMIPHELMRSLLLWGGISPNLDSSDSFYSNGDIIGISSSQKGKKTLSFPSEFRLKNLWNGEEFNSQDKKVSFKLDKAETFIGRVFKQF